MLLFGDAPRPSDRKPVTIYDLHGTGRASGLFVLQDRARLFVYFKVDKPTRDRSKRFTQDGTEAHAEQGNDCFTAPGLGFRDYYKTRHKSGVTLLNEGMVPNWTHGGHIVLETQRKVTTNLGFGLNCGIDDVVTLANHLQDLTKVKDVSDRAAFHAAYHCT